MQLTATQLTLPGALPGPQDPQPFFRAPVQDLKVPQNGTFLPRDEEGYGVGCGARTLPYRMQDRYTRSSEPAGAGAGKRASESHPDAHPGRAAVVPVRQGRGA